MSGIDSLITIDLAYSQAVVIWEFDNAPQAIQRLAAPYGSPHSDFDIDWIVFVPEDVDYHPFLKLGLSQAVFMYDGQAGSKIIVYKEYM